MDLILDVLCGAGVGWLLVWGAPKVGAMVEEILNDLWNGPGGYS